MESQNIAVIGSGIAGLSAAWLLQYRHQVTLFEKNNYVGGHTHTVEVETEHGLIPVDTGFIVFNEPNYPNLNALFNHLDVASRSTDMSFAASIDQGQLEYAGSDLNTLFAQRENLLSPQFLGMLRDILRFNRQAKKMLSGGVVPETTLGEYLHKMQLGDRFRNHYLLPMAGAIWSCPPRNMLDFPLASLVRFFANHGLLDLFNRPQWRTVIGGSHTYVNKMLQTLDGQVRVQCAATRVRREADGVWVYHTGGQRERFDQVVLASHADETLALLENPSYWEQRLLKCFQYQRNHAVLHTDPRLMPKKRRVWSSWNYLANAKHDQVSTVSVTYWMNRLQGLPDALPLFVSLNPLEEPQSDRVIATMDYDHPVFDTGAMRAQQLLPRIQGKDRLWFCGSYCGYGFHEDALRSGIAAARLLGGVLPWETTPPTAAQSSTRVVGNTISPTLGIASDSRKQPALP